MLATIFYSLLIDILSENTHVFVYTCNALLKPQTCTQFLQVSAHNSDKDDVKPPSHSTSLNQVSNDSFNFPIDSDENNLPTTLKPRHK